MDLPYSAQEFAKAAKRATITEKELLEAVVEIDMEPVRLARFGFPRSRFVSGPTGSHFAPWLLYARAVCGDSSAVHGQVW